MKIELNKISNSFEVCELTNISEIVYEGKNLIDSDNAEKQLLIATSKAVAELCSGLASLMENEYTRKYLHDSAEDLYTSIKLVEMTEHNRKRKEKKCGK